MGYSSFNTVEPLLYGQPWDQIVLISEVSIFQRKKELKLGHLTSVLINQVS